MELFQEVAESQESKEENEDATVAADALEKLSVEGKKTEENAGEEAPAATKNEETKTDTDKKGEKPAPST